MDSPCYPVPLFHHESSRATSKQGQGQYGGWARPRGGQSGELALWGEGVGSAACTESGDFRGSLGQDTQLPANTNISPNTSPHCTWGN